MKRFVALCALFALAAAVMGFDKPPGAVGMRPARFVAVDVMVDSGATGLGAWQIEFSGESSGGAVELVGVEAGEHAAFSTPGYHDPEALSKDRVIVAAYALGKDLPTGKTRIARLHLRVTGERDPEYKVEMMKAADAAGNEIKPTTTVQTVEGDR